MSCTPYAERLILEDLERLDAREIDPRHVEAYMRLTYGTLDSLSRHQWTMEVAVAVGHVRYDPAGAERLAESYGL